MQGALEHVDGERDLPPEQMDGRERAGGAAIDIEAFEQLLGLLEASLPHAQVGEPDQGTRPQPRAPTEAPEPDGSGQRGVGLRPTARRGQDAAIVRAAEGRNRRELPPRGDRLADSDPLARAGDVARVLAGREELAEDLLQHEEVVDLAARHRRERLVEQHHALLGMVGVDHARPEVRERHELQVAVAEPARHLERLVKALLLALPIDVEHPAGQRHPSGLGRLRLVPQQRLRAREPAAGDRPVADHRAV